MSEHQHEQEARRDTESDPARDDREGGEWVTEGGATEEGPATETTADDPEK